VAMKARAHLFAAAFAALLMSPVAALAGSDAIAGGSTQVAKTGTDATSSTAAASDQSYQLGAGDKVRLSVFGESDLGGEFEIDGSGDIGVRFVRADSVARVASSKLYEAVREAWAKTPEITHSRAPL